MAFTAGSEFEEWALRRGKQNNMVLLVVPENGVNVDVIGLIKPNRKNNTNVYTLADVLRVHPRIRYLLSLIIITETRANMQVFKPLSHW